MKPSFTSGWPDRLPGVLAAAVAAWRRWPFPVVVTVGAGVTALVRLAAP